MRILPVEAGLFHADRWTGEREVTMLFANLRKSLINMIDVINETITEKYHEHSKAQ
jgi:hypothetical protein